LSEYEGLSPVAPVPSAVSRPRCGRRPNVGAGGRIWLTASQVIDSPRIPDMAWPAQMVVEPGDEISGLPEEGNGQPAPIATRTGPASSLENQEGRGQQGFEG
ncbi:unnamed protein product, partial [Ectocarpus sp. 13 AM-2016]